MPRQGSSLSHSHLNFQNRKTKTKQNKTKTQNKAIPAPQFPAFSAAMSSAEGSTTFSSVFTWKKMSL